MPKERLNVSPEPLENKNTAIAEDITPHFTAFASTMQFPEGQTIDTVFDIFLSPAKSIIVEVSGSSADDLEANFKAALQKELNAIPEKGYEIRSMKVEFRYLHSKDGTSADYEGERQLFPV